MSAAGAAFVNGTAAHGEDFDDTFEGGPVHAGAVLDSRGARRLRAAWRRSGGDGAAALKGIAVGIETMCRLSTVAPTKAHKAGFHPTAVFGAAGAAAGVATALGLTKKQTVDALGIVGSMASGIIEYLAEGTWTKRMHAGWAAQSGLRAALLARAGFSGPRTVFEGTHGLFHGFANTLDGDYDALIGDFGTRWVTQTLAFKPYPCGTMTHPYIDCARRLARAASRRTTSKEMVCEVGEGTVHRLWEPLAAKQTPNERLFGQVLDSPIASPPASSAATWAWPTSPTQAVKDKAVLALAGKVRYRIDPDNPYPKNFTGHIRVTLNDGSVVEERQPHMRGGGARAADAGRHRGQIHAQRAARRL